MTNMNVKLKQDDYYQNIIYTLSKLENHKKFLSLFSPPIRLAVVVAVSFTTG